VTGILADVNIEGHVDYLIDLATSDEWIEFWQFLGLTYARFADLGLREEASDVEIWRVCQEKGYVLITGNRNDDDADSLESTIRTSGTPASLPVLTLADPERVRRDRQYAGGVVLSLIETLMDIDATRGAGRLYLP
jgi:predicted nuclease of predicted toxin-antitoxin system